MHSRRPAVRRSLLGSAALAAALGVAAPAAAQEGFSLAKLQPSFAGDRLFGVPSPYTAGESTFHAMVLLDYAHDPLILRGQSTGDNLGAIVSDQELLHLDVSYALGRVVTFNLDVPFGFQHGESPTGGNLTFGSPTSTALADVRLGARATLYGETGDAFQLAVEALVWLPTGSTSAYTSDGTLRSQPMLIAGGATRAFVWSASIGPDLRPNHPFTTVTIGPSLRWGVGMGFLPGDGTFQVGPEVSGGVGLGDTEPRTLDLEAMLGAKVRFGRDFEAGFAAALGLAHGVGTPDFRSVLSIAYAPRATPPVVPVVDRDGDGIPDAEDACPDHPGVRDPDPGKNGCPVIPDRDGDGIPDAEDACPDVPGVPDPLPKLNGCPADRDNDGIPDGEDACPDQIGTPNPDPKKNGCPGAADRDKDGIPDAEDACPDVPGVADADPKKNGCPGDRDKDGIPDDKDACPDEKGPADADPKKNGCPKDVRVTDGQIVILQQVEFDIGRASIRKVSGGLLDTVAQVFREHPEIVRVEVQGHTDNTGSADVNTALSQARAEAVAAALAQRGIEAGRLVAKGYGSTHPIEANVTKQGQQKNRRVEFHILERRPKQDAKKL
jgi:OmpA-OmpF porin, OOP family